MTVVTAVAAKGDAALADARQYGTKAAGLAGLDPGWTPDFFAIRVGAVDGIEDERLKASIAGGLRRLGPCSSGVIVRSSALEEDLNARGSFDSECCPATADAVMASMRKIATEAPSQSGSSLGFIVQEWLAGVATGHLSNERRVSREVRSWLCEAELPIEAADKGFRFRVDSRTRDSSDMRCSSWEELAAAIRGVARSMHGGGARFHLEWVWDGDRLWIVQADEDEVPIEAPPGSAWRVDGNSHPLGRLRVFKPVSGSSTPFPKVNHVGVFRECGLPSGDIRVLCGALVIRRLAQGQISRDLRRDLADLIEEPVVVRTDFRADTAQPQVLSKRTDTCRTFDELQQFLVDTARLIVEAGHAPGDLAFLAHRFMVARAGAISFGQCGSSRVHIDATWGLPDSLLFHPHDSFRVDTGTGRVERYLRCKTDYVDVTSDGSWKSRAAGREWDWRPALTDDEAREIGGITSRIADHLGKDIEVMFFVGGAGAGHNILPWFFSETEHGVADVQAARGYYVGERVAISDFADLDRLDFDLRALGGAQRLSVVLRPTYELLRSREFILKVAEVAKNWKLPVELEGSQLSHAYYLLEDAGAATRCLNPWNPPERRQSFGKLVRDLVPVRIERRGEVATTYPADRLQLVELIKAKTVEEALELYWAEGDASVEELADLLEILQTAARVDGTEFAEVIRVADAKRRERGGFENGVVLVETRDANRLQRSSGENRRPLTTLPVGASPRRRPLPTRRVVRLPGGRLVLPLVPPTGWKIGEARTMALTAEDSVRITYGADEILVHIRPRPSNENRDQLALFDEGKKS